MECVGGSVNLSVLPKHHGSQHPFWVFLPMTLYKSPQVWSNIGCQYCCNEAESLKMQTSVMHVGGKLG